MLGFHPVSKAPLSALEVSSDKNVVLSGTSGTADVGTLSFGGSCSVGAVAVAITLALSGVTGTGETGILTPAPPISGISAPASVGTMPPEMAIVLAGIEALGSVDSVAPGSGFPLGGDPATGAVGSVEAVIPGIVAISGTEATAAVGNVCYNGECSVGDVAPGEEVALTTVAATGAVGTVTAQSGVGGDITLPITGVSANPAYQLSGLGATGAVGNVTVVGSSDIILPLTGIAGTGSVGSVVYLAEGVGAGMTGQVGSVTPVVAPPVATNVATAAVGNIIPSASLVLVGNEVTGEVGGWGLATSPLTGVAGTGDVGTVTPNAAPAITGTPGTGSVGEVAPTHPWAISGVESTGLVGTVGVTVGSSGDSSVAITGVAVATAVGTVVAEIGGYFEPPWAAGGITLEPDWPAGAVELEPAWPVGNPPLEPPW